MEVPMIRIDNWDHESPVTLYYHSGTKELNFKAVYVNIKKIGQHPGRGSLETVRGTDGGEALQLKECDDAFLTKFSRCLARLLEYFLNIYDLDTPLNNATWYHLVDVLLKAALELPHRFYLPHQPSCSHAKGFNTKFERTLDLINSMVTGDKKGGPGRLIHHNGELTANVVTDGSSFKSGLTVWEQFLTRGSPGMSEASGSQRHIPMGGLAILQRHTERIRDIAQKYTESEDYEKDHTMPKEEFMARLDNVSFKLGEESEGLEPVRTSSILRTPGFNDPAKLLQAPERSDLDERLGSMRGVEPIQQPTEEFEILRVKEE
ncbi:hypothetical protein BCR34DRAFT_601310 [Clohesyomyces aquaticus]|uniref:Uncharacterized protein n=1 Tax=Clohesyomyces aquaticus TaxID=1231657 RepID=A0A1Y1ZMQ9_9PLEO|nr:hypothetical protein BCR34DRAFT_601310 [Clohesyomyces aquaticus]